MFLLAAGCASVRSIADKGAPDDKKGWLCSYTYDVWDDRPSTPEGTWVSVGGSMVTVCRSSVDDPRTPGLESPEASVENASAAAVFAALDLLEQRGISYTAERRDEIVSQARESFASGDDSAFPRMVATLGAMEQCVLAASGDTLWRASMMVDYPIAHLRGDVNNVRWERRRAAREALVLMASADDHFSSGRWMAGLQDLRRTASVVGATGVGDRAEHLNAVSPLTGLPAAVDEQLQSAREWSELALRSAWDLTLTPGGEIDVVESGMRVGTVLEFTCTFGWRGHSLPAAGVPVRFEMASASAVLDAGTTTDSSGVARCRIVVALGEPGEYEVTATVDTDAVSALGLPTGGSRGPFSSQRVFVVSGAHAISLCMEVTTGSAADAAQLEAGFVRRAERDGFRVDECGADIDVLVSSRASMSTYADGAVWAAEVVVTASAFDQRTAEDIGEIEIRVEETSTEGQRGAEVVALKEAGRLLAVWCGARALSAGL